MIRVPASSSYSIFEPSRCASKLMDRPSARPVKRRNWLRVRLSADLRRQTVVLVADVIVERLGAVLVDQLRELFQAHGFAELGLAAGVVHQGLGLFPGGVFRQVFAFDEVAERLEQGTGLARAVDAFLAADEVAEVLRDFLAVLALDERDVLFRLLVVLPLGDVDPRGQVQLAQVQVADGVTSSSSVTATPSLWCSRAMAR